MTNIDSLLLLSLAGPMITGREHNPEESVL